jgi:hypothetical protein
MIKRKKHSFVMSAIRYIPFQFPGMESVSCVFTTRLGGHSIAPYSSANLSFDVGDQVADVQANRKSLMSLCGLSSCHELKQIHGNQMLELSISSQGSLSLPEGDALMTDLHEQGLMIKTADCQPILMAHCSGNAIAAMHCGWRGNKNNVLRQWVTKLCQRYNFPPQELLAIRGPSLGPDKSQFINFSQEWSGEFLSYFNETDKTVNLWQLTRDQLMSAGLLPEHIFQLDLCTYSLPELFFSYRRERDTGRQAALIWKHA